MSKTSSLPSRHEADVAAWLGGRVTPGSGSKAVRGDVRSEAYRAECKLTEKRSRALSLDEWETIAGISAMAGVEPLLFTRFEGPVRRDLVTMDVDTFRELLKCTA